MSALLRLLLIILCASSAVIFSLFALRTMGGMQSYQGPHHAWVELISEQKFLVIQRRGCSLDELKKQSEDVPQSIQWVTIKPGPEATWNVECSPSYPLADLVKALPKLSYLFELNAKSDYGFDALKRLFEPMAENNSVGFFSASHIAIKQLRKEFPQWLFVADPTSLVKIHFFESMFIETLADVWPDVFITHNDIHKAEYLSPRLLSELARRKKIVIWDDTKGNTPIPLEVKPYISGILTTKSIASRSEKP
jgi:hypothetical protein